MSRLVCSVFESYCYHKPIFSEVPFGFINFFVLSYFFSHYFTTLDLCVHSNRYIVFSTAYYFTPMILNGCLALASGVIESYCYHKPTSSEVPFWIYKLLRKRRDLKHQVQTGHGEVMNSSDPSEAKNVVRAEDFDDAGGLKSINVSFHTPVTWRDLASLINRLMLALCILITLGSVITITINFLLLY